MDILSTALLKLDVVKVRSRRRSSFDLCEILEEFVRRGLVDSSAVRCCRGIEELIQVSDYDISNFDAFEEEVLAEIEVLQEELEQTFAILEKRTAVED